MRRLLLACVLALPTAGAACPSDAAVAGLAEALAAGRDHLAILRHLDQVIPEIELPRTGLIGQMNGPALDPVDVAARLGVVGTPIPIEPTAELARAQGGALLGRPLNVIPWPVEALARSGQRLRAGEIVSLGGLASPVPAVAGRAYGLRYEGLAPQPVGASVKAR
jgi:2-keto-4-pentenoate hydratase